MKSDKFSKTPRKAFQFSAAAHASQDRFPNLENALNGNGGDRERLRQRRTARFLARLRRAVLPVALLLAGAWAAAAAAPVITATLEPAEIAFGDVAQLTVTVQGQDQNAPLLPSVSGLSFQPVGQSSQIQVINGEMTANTSHTYIASPTRLGTFTIPAIKAGLGPNAAESTPVVLKVLKRAAGSTPVTPQAYPNQSVLPAPTVNGSDDSTPPPDPHGFGFLRLVSPKKEFYVGELVPVELKAFFRAGVELRVDGLPKLNSDAFTMNKLSDQPARSEQVFGGVPYTLFTWSTALTAVKAGDYQMSVELPTTVTVRQRVQRPRTRSGNPFGDPIFDEFFNDAFFDGFFGSATQKEVALSSEPSAVKILSVPMENRPSTFAGAIGRFELTAEAAPLQAAAGDPVTLKVKITGSGNFERATFPALEKNDHWKTYKPSAKFEPDDSAGCTGTKTFEQALVPLQSGKLIVPALAFSYFDPESRQYITRSTQPLSIQVGPGQSVASTAASGPAANDPPVARPSGEPGMAPNKLVPGRFHATLRPWFFNSWLAVGALLPSLGVLAAYWFMCRRQELARDPHRVRLAETQRAVQAQLRLMESSARRGSTSEFFAAARGAFQSRLGMLWGLVPQTITLVEVNTRLNGEADGFRFVFELADEVTYTGRTFGTAELQKWYEMINAELKKLERT
jgi:hypothetical protein